MNKYVNKWNLQTYFPPIYFFFKAMKKGIFYFHIFFPKCSEDRQMFWGAGHEFSCSVLMFWTGSFGCSESALLCGNVLTSKKAMLENASDLRNS